MAKKFKSAMKEQKVAGKSVDFGKWAFLVGLFIAVIAGIFGSQAVWVTVALMILGLIVGALNVTVRETGTFLIAVVALIISSSVVMQFGINLSGLLALILKYIILFMAP